MKAHDLARKLLAGKNLPVVINGWGSDQGSSFQVNDVSPPGKCSFNGTFDTAKTKRDAAGYISDRPCLVLQYGGRTPPSKAQLKAERQRKRKMEHDRKTLTPGAFKLCYHEPGQISPSDIVNMVEKGASFSEVFKLLTPKA